MNRLYSMAQAFVDKYNAEYKCSLQIQNYSDSGFSLPYISNDNIHIDKSNFIWLAFYFFGNPKLFIYYRLLKGILEYNNVDETATLLRLIRAEYNASYNRFHYLLSQNPDWIPAQTMTITLHELAHHRFGKDRNIYNLFVNNAKEFLRKRPFELSKDYVPNVDFEAAGLDYEGLRQFVPEVYDAIIEDDLEDEGFLEELAADSFVFNHFSQSISGCGINKAIASFMALSGGCVFYLEYANRTNQLLINPINGDKQERNKNNLVSTILSSANSRIRAIYQDFHINKFFMSEGLDEESRKLYSTLVGVPLFDYNESLDVEFMKSLQHFQDILNEGCQIDFDKYKLESVNKEVKCFEDSIISMILQELSKKSTISNPLN